MSSSQQAHPRAAIEFVVLSFEGPDLYSLVGGLGVRVTEMTQVMAKLGYNTRLFFVGDPDEPDYQVSEDGLLHYHRWSRWLSKQYPEGVYHGELAKVEDYTKSVPEFLVGRVIAANAEKGVVTVVLGEDWQTAKTMCRVSELLKKNGLAESALLFWNANNVYGFETVDFGELQNSVQLLTISRYMKERMRSLKLETMLVPNGIPPRFWARIDKKFGTQVRELFPGLLLAKVGRYHEDKRWLMAIESVAHCKELGLKPTLVVRGGSEKHGETVRSRAIELGLTWARVKPASSEPAAILECLSGASEFDVVELDFFVPESFLRVLYWASAAVLANSGHEPFGLVGLEVMACGGLAITGSTGEEYLINFHNGLALSSEEPRELAIYLRDIYGDVERAEALRHNARASAKIYNWSGIIEDYLLKIELVAWKNGIKVKKINNLASST